MLGGLQRAQRDGGTRGTQILVSLACSLQKAALVAWRGLLGGHGSRPRKDP